jgi:hypothetical protein
VNGFSRFGGSRTKACAALWRIFPLQAGDQLRGLWRLRMAPFWRTPPTELRPHRAVKRATGGPRDGLRQQGNAFGAVLFHALKGVASTECRCGGTFRRDLGKVS